MHKGMMLAVSAATLLASAAFAQDNSGNLEKLGQFKTTGASPNIPMIPQGGAKAGAEKECGKDQVAARLPYRALRNRTRRAPHGGRAARNRHLRRYPQGSSLCR